MVFFRLNWLLPKKAERHFYIPLKMLCNIALILKSRSEETMPVTLLSTFDRTIGFLGKRWKFSISDETWRYDPDHDNAEV